MPVGEQFVFARWTEITDERAPWWTLPTGVGLRLGLAELAELAEIRGSGGVAKAAVSRLIEDAKRVLLHSNSYCARRYKAAVDDIRHSLRDDAAEAWVPGALGPSSIEAALELIDTTEYLHQLAGDLAVDAAAIKDISGSVAAAEAFSKLEALVELLDAELVHDGHSLAWRRQVLQEAAGAYRGGANLRDAILSALGANRYGQRRRFDVLVPATHIKDPPSGQVGLVWLDPTLATGEIITTWRADGTKAVLDDERLKKADGLVRYELSDVDLHAAGREVSRMFGRDVDLWRLRGGSVTPGEVAFVFDRDALRVEAVKLPAEPLDLLPQSLGNYGASAATNDRETTSVDDALLQLAQARTSPPATALVNLWSAAEAVFGGAIGDVRGDVGNVMAGLAELLYLRDLLRWLGDRYTAAEFSGAPEGGSSRWGLERSLQKTTEVLDSLANHGDALAWWRLKCITRWDTGASLREQLTAFSERMEQVATRAYLVRNLALHRAKVRQRTLAVTLPVFAALVRECIGYAAEGDHGRTLKAAKFAGQQMRHTANEVERDPTKASDLLRQLLPRAPQPPVRDESVAATEELESASPGQLRTEAEAVDETVEAKLVPVEALIPGPVDSDTGPQPSPESPGAKKVATKKRR